MDICVKASVKMCVRGSVKLWIELVHKAFINYSYCTLFSCGSIKHTQHPSKTDTLSPEWLACVLPLFHSPYAVCYMSSASLEFSLYVCLMSFLVLTLTYCQLLCFFPLPNSCACRVLPTLHIFCFSPLPPSRSVYLLLSSHPSLSLFLSLFFYPHLFSGARNEQATRLENDIWGGGPCLGPIQKRQIYTYLIAFQ